MTMLLSPASERMLQTLCKETHAPPPAVIERAILTLCVAILGPTLQPITKPKEEES